MQGSTRAARNFSFSSKVEEAFLESSVAVDSATGAAVLNTASSVANAFQKLFEARSSAVVLPCLVSRVGPPCERLLEKFLDAVMAWSVSAASDLSSGADWDTWATVFRWEPSPIISLCL
jgi:hypothetical protein